MFSLKINAEILFLVLRVLIFIFILFIFLFFKQVTILNLETVAAPG